MLTGFILLQFSSEHLKHEITVTVKATVTSIKWEIKTRTFCFWLKIASHCEGYKE